MRLSLRAMMLLVVPLAAWLGWCSNEARVQRRAVAAIREAGGRVLYSWERKDGNSIPGGRPKWPGWMVEALGVDYFGSVVFAELEERSSDAEMAHVGRLSRLEELYLDISGSSHEPISQVTDAGMSHVAGLSRLRFIRLSSNRVGDSGLDHLKGLGYLEEMTILMTQATPGGIARLRKSLPKLRLTWYGCTSPSQEPDRSPPSRPG